MVYLYNKHFTTTSHLSELESPYTAPKKVQILLTLNCIPILIEISDFTEIAPSYLISVPPLRPLGCTKNSSSLKHPPPTFVIFVPPLSPKCLLSSGHVPVL